MDAALLNILACPICKGKLEYRAKERQLVCRADQLIYPIGDDDVPILLAEEALPLNDTTNATDATNTTDDASPSNPTK